MQGLWRLEDMLDTPEMKAERAHAKQLEVRVNVSGKPSPPPPFRSAALCG
jgi:hypothetical protein